MTNYKVLATWDISITNLYKDITLIQQGISCKLNISLRSISRVTVNYKVGNEYLTDLCTIDLDNNKVIVPFKKNVLEVGANKLELVCHMKNGDVLVSPTYIYDVIKSLDNTNDITEEDAYPVLIGMIQELTKNEAIIQANEEARATAEMYRELNEDERQNAEAERKANENTRISNENIRQSNESSRQEYETQRRAEEVIRQGNESDRISKEAERLANETSRVTAENSRVEAENTRAEFYEGFNDRLNEVDSQLVHIENKIEKQFINVDDFGAKGDGVTDDTEAIQSAIDYAHANNISTVMFSNKTYAIRGIDENNTTGLQRDSDDTKTGIQCKTGINLVGSSMNETIIKVIPNSHETYSIFMIRGRKNIKISDMTLQGDTLEHLGTAGEWGHGINCIMSQNIILENLKIIDMWGDGIYLGLGYTSGIYFEDISRNIVIRNVEIDNVGRNGLSLCTVDTLYIDNLKCKNITRTFPKSGIDIEAEGYADGFDAVLKNIRINNYYAEKCVRGVEIYTGITNIDYDIEFNNYTAYNNAQALLCEDFNSNTGSIRFNNFYSKNSRYNSIMCLNKSATYELIIDNLNILNNGVITAETNALSILERAAISITCSKDMERDIGNIKLNNIRIHNDNNVLCRQPIYISTFGTNGSIVASNGFKFKDISITNINEYTSLNEGAGGNGYMYVKHAEFKNLEIDTRKFIYNGTYAIPAINEIIGNVSVMSDRGTSSKLVFYMNDNINTSVYNGFEITIKKENPLLEEMVISTVNKKINGLENPNEFNYLYTKQNGSELKIKLINEQWYVVDIKGTWLYRGGVG